MANQKNNLSAAQWGAIATIAAALIGLCGVVATSCISNPENCRFTEMPTPAPATTAPANYTTTTIPPIFTPTDTVTPISIPTPSPTPTSPVNAFVGTWVNIEKNPSAHQLTFPLTRVLIGNNGDGSFSYKACGETTSGERYIDATNVSGKYADDVLTLNPFHISSQIMWTIKLTFLPNGGLSANVTEGTNIMWHGIGTYELVRVNTNLRPIIACGEPVLSP